MPEAKGIVGDTRYRKCPTCGFATIYKGQVIVDYMELITRIRPLLTAVDTRESRLLRQEIDVLLLTR